MDASSSSFSARDHGKSQYEVFISFHGGDVRWGFLSHLIRALKLKQINAFDDTKLTRTEGFATELLRIIEQSYLSIVIFSQKYPTSKYCVIELEKIHESMQSRGHRAFPVFHKVDTSDVQNLLGNYEVMALMEQKWRDALETISCKSGADYKTFQERFRREGPMSLREEIIRGLLSDENLKIDSSLSVGDSILRRIKRVKVLLVLDDVSEYLQLKTLLEMSGLASRDSFCRGSRIIVTTRDRQVSQHVVFEKDIYEVKQLEDMEALELLCWTAFGQSNPEQGYEDLSKKAVRYAGGVPQVLIILGSELKRKSIMFWENALAKYRTTSPLGVQDFLRININQGLDFEEKSIFLDIACFLKGYARNHVENILKIFGFHAEVGIGRLVDKSLVKEEKKDGKVIITMHDLLEQTGQQIVAEEKQSKGHGTRLCTFDDVKDALTNNTGTGNVEVISLYCYGDRIIEINPEAFIHMSKLRGLIFESNSVSESVNCPIVKPGLEFLPNSIKYLHWDNFSQNGWPSNFDADKLVELHLKRSHLAEIIWSKPLPRLKVIVLSESKDLKKISDLAMAPNLEVIDLSYCRSLFDIGQSLQNLNKLMKLNVKGCGTLSNLPKLPCSLVKLDLSYSGLKKLPSTVGRLISLEVLNLSYCERLVEIESSFENLKKLARLDVDGCRGLSSLPELPSSIAEFGVFGTGLQLLPSTVGHLTILQNLSLNSCRKLESLPDSVCNLSSIKSLDFIDCIKLQKLPDNFGNLKWLEHLYVSYSGLTELPESFQNLENLMTLEMAGCQQLGSLPSLPSNIELFFSRCCKSQFNEEKSSMVEQFLQKVHDQPTKIHRLCVDDERQVPEWMIYSNDSGALVSLDPETDADSTSFIFFVVISTISYPDWESLQTLNLVARLTDGNLQRYQSYANSSGERPRIAHDEGENPSYFFLWNCNIECKSLKKVSFELRNGPEFGKIMKCGVHPISRLEELQQQNSFRG